MRVLGLGADLGGRGASCTETAAGTRECAPPQAQYAVYSEEQLQEREKAVLAEVTSVLSITDAEAVRVLRLYKWCAMRHSCL